MGQETLGTFDFRLTSKDEQNLKTFRTLLKMDNIEVFSSDDFRRYGLDRFIKDTQHGIGTFFSKLVKNRVIVHVGYKPSEIISNHSHEIKTYRWSNSP